MFRYRRTFGSDQIHALAKNRVETATSARRNFTSNEPKRRVRGFHYASATSHIHASRWLISLSLNVVSSQMARDMLMVPLMR